MDLHEVCRICLLPKEMVQSILGEIQLPHSKDTKLSKHSILDILKIFTDITVYPNDDILDIICCDCLDKVRRSFTFKLKLEKSEAILNELKDGGNSINELTDSPNEYCDYSEGIIKKIKTEKEDYEKLEQTTVPDIFPHVISYEQEFKQEPEIQINIEYFNETDSSENGSKMKNTSNLNGHTLTSTEELPFQCEVCLKKYRFRSSLKEHMKTSHDLNQCTDESLFECEECPNDYRFKSIFVLHMKTAHATTSMFQCPICSKCFGSKSKLDKHVINHTKKRVFQCDVCPENFQSNRKLTKHVRTEHPEGTHNINLKCSICSKLFGHEHNLKQHMIIHTGEKPFSCEICGKNVRFKSNLTEHVRKVHGDCATNNLKFECVICSKFFEHKTYLQEHTLIHSQERLFQCEFCPKNVKSKEKFTEHMRTAHPESTASKITLKCPICSKLFTQEGNLKEHMNIHTGERPFKCEICEKKFRFKNSLREHRRRVHGVRSTNVTKFECSICSKSFEQKNCLNRHMLIHTAETSFQCSFCKTIFQCQRDLSDHMHTVHAEIIADNKELTCPICYKLFGFKRNLKRHMLIHSEERSFQCEFCPNNFHSKDRLTKHMRTGHPECIANKIKFKCTICSKLFIQEGKLKEHMNIHTGERPFACEICEKKFLFKNSLREHKRRVHGVCGTNIRQLECSKLFEQKNNLKQDILIHTAERLFQCEFCPKNFESNDNLTQHMQTCTVNKIKSKCPICSKLYFQEDKLKEHMNIHTGERPFHCEICDKNFLFKKNLRDHKRSVHGVCSPNVRKFQCSICSKLFTQKNYLNRHMLIHTAERSFQCGFCPTVLQCQRDLSDHIHTTHTENIADNKKLKCPICNKLFEFNQQNLKRHLLIHTGEKPFFCEMCKTKFRYKSSLREHMTKIHDVYSTNNEKIECSICSKVFGRKTYLKRHMLIHTAERSLQCELCPNTFQCKNDLSQHMRMSHSDGTWNNEKFKCSICSKVFPHEYIPQHMLIHTKEKPFVCEICPRKFRFKSNLTEHMRRIHAEDTKNN